MIKTSPLTFLKGLRDGIPIALGYISVSFTFGIIVVSYGMPIWTPILTSLTNFTGTGQFIGMEMLSNGSALMEIAFTMVIVNARYILMSISLSQRLAPKTGFFKRSLISFGVTDEIFAVAIGQQGDLNFKYLMGLMIGSFSGWIGGTALGALAGSVIPAIILSAMGITIYAMFIAIIVPPAKESRPVMIVIIIAVAISSLLYLIKPLRENNFYIIIIAGIISTLVVTFIHPIHDEVDTDNGVEYEQDAIEGMSDSNSRHANADTDNVSKDKSNKEDLT